MKMKKSALAIAACLMVSGTAGIAEELVTSSDGWSGLYGGIQAGYLWGHGDIALDNIPGSG
jgi:opacity protein-like surface antigen